GIWAAAHGMKASSTRNNGFMGGFCWNSGRSASGLLFPLPRRCRSRCEWRSASSRRHLLPERIVEPIDDGFCLPVFFNEDEVVAVLQARRPDAIANVYPAAFTAHLRPRLHRAELATNHLIEDEDLGRLTDDDEKQIAGGREGFTPNLFFLVRQ